LNGYSNGLFYPPDPNLRDDRLLNIGVGQVDESNTPGQYSPVTLQSTLNLKSGDQIWLEIFTQSTGASLTTVSTSLILRVLCCRRKLWPHFNDFFIIHQIIFNYYRKKIMYVWGNGIKYNRISKVAKGWVFVDEN
jgi:hypothetical protein